MEFSYEGIGQVVATFAKGAGVEAGMAVTIVGDGAVGLGKAGDTPCGVATAIGQQCCGVQVSGFAQVAYTGAAPTVGYATLAVDGAGAVKTASAGLTCLVVQVDTTAKTAVIKF